MHFLILLTLVVSFSTFAQSSADPFTSSACPTSVCPECPKCERGKTEGYRKDSTGSLMLGYQFLNTWVIGKKAVSYTHNFDRSWSFEFEFATSKRDQDIMGVELGEIQEDRYTLFAKYFLGNSFHFSFGPYMYDITMHINDEIVDRSGNKIDDTWELEGYGMAFAFGNRWETKWGLTYGIDWIRMNMPLIDGKIKRRDSSLDNNDQDDIERSFNIIRRAPAYTFFAINLGYTF